MNSIIAVLFIVLYMAIIFSVFYKENYRVIKIKKDLRIINPTMLKRTRKKTINAFFDMDFEQMNLHLEDIIMCDTYYRLSESERISAASILTKVPLKINNMFITPENIKQVNESFVILYGTVIHAPINQLIRINEHLRPSQRANTVLFLAFYHLYNNNITEFLQYYKEYLLNLTKRTEKLILNEDMNTYLLADTELTFDVTLLDLYHRFYNTNVFIEKELEEYQPKNKLEQHLYTKLLKHYYHNTERPLNASSLDA